MPKILSLLPSATEIVCALGFRDHLVGRSHECDYPPDVSTLPICSSPRLSFSKKSLNIHHQLKEVIESTLSIYRLDIDKLLELQPEIIITQSQCEICAISIEEVEHVVKDCLGQEVCIVSMEATNLTEVYKDIEKIASALNVEKNGVSLINTMKKRFQKIETLVHHVKNKLGVVVIDWIEPIISSGHWMTELVTIAGGHQLLGDAGSQSHIISMADLVAVDPEYLFVIPCGFKLEDTLREIIQLEQRPEWQQLSAYTHGKIAIADGNAFFNRSGPRLVESAEVIAEILYPEIINFGHKGKFWLQYERETSRYDYSFM